MVSQNLWYQVGFFMLSLFPPFTDSQSSESNYTELVKVRFSSILFFISLQAISELFFLFG